MPNVINAYERNQAFIKFMAFFLLTIISIVCAVYVDFRGLPQKRQKLLDEQFANQRSESQVQQQFVLQMEKAKILLDSLEKSGKDRLKVEAALAGKLNDMQNIKLIDTSLNGKLNNTILESFLELQQLKKELGELRMLPAKLADLDAKLKDAENSLDEYRSRPQQVQEQQNY
ncbi:MAG TPA: type VI secretion system TssO [Flavitalea sp.]|nr:type VI secretion system TssO [Flavitalea sp.]